MHNKLIGLKNYPDIVLTDAMERELTQDYLYAMPGINISLDTIGKKVSGALTGLSETWKNFRPFSREYNLYDKWQDRTPATTDNLVKYIFLLFDNNPLRKPLPGFSLHKEQLDINRAAKIMEKMIFSLTEIRKERILFVERFRDIIYKLTEDSAVYNNSNDLALFIILLNKFEDYFFKEMYLPLIFIRLTSAWLKKPDEKEKEIVANILAVCRLLENEGKIKELEEKYIAPVLAGTCP
ncbi:MAG: hypothetical protein PHV30_10090 [Candidatus Margulisbacteria bacterium]|nr:hypothetical protein [Candidatus Margulisiibacteriota bacterium]